MSKFNLAGAWPTATSALLTARTPTLVNARGGPGYERDPQTELFLLAVSHLVGEHNAHERAGARDERFTSLIHSVSLEHPEWTAALLPWLRTEMNLRSAPLVGAAEFVAAMRGVHTSGAPSNERSLARRVVDAVQQRADEPGEMLAYWLTHYGRRLPQALRRGTADAVARLYNGKAVLTWDRPNKAVRFGDVIEMVHPTVPGWRNDVLRYALDRRHGRTDPRVGDVRTLQARAALMAVPREQRRALLLAPDAAQRLREAAMSWQAVAGWLGSEMDGPAWTAVAPTMGYMAKIMNLRNFDEKGLPDELASQIAAEIADPQAVADSRQLPLAYLSAYRNIASDRWAWPLEKALEHSLRRITRLPGRTLVLIDTSDSMNVPLSRHSTLTRMDAAVLFGLAVARRCDDPDVISFSNGYWGSPPHMHFEPVPGETLLRSMRRWEKDGYNIKGGTDTVGALSCGYRGHDRVVIVTDEQAEHSWSTVTDVIPSAVPVYTWNLGGYRVGHAPSGGRNRHVLAGLNDAAFSIVPILERGAHAGWPFMAA